MALPLLLMVPVLFIAGVVFCYFVVLTPAMHFLLNFNADEFNTQVRARDYYRFVTLTMLAMGIGFQIPVVILAACKLRHHHARRSCASNRRYAIARDRGAGGAAAHDRPAHADPRDGPAVSCSTSSASCSPRRSGRPLGEVPDRIASAEGSH